MITFRMSGISIEQFAILSTDLPPKDAPINIQTDIHFSAAFEKPTILTHMKFTYLGQDDAPLLILELVCRFKIDEDSWNEMHKNGNLVVPKGFLAHMAVHTVGTARGILFCKTEGTALNLIILPPINVAEMITEDFVVKPKG